MELATIEMERSEAREALRQYRADVKAAAERRRGDADRDLEKIDAAVMRGYRELARGNRIHELSKTIAAGGVLWHEGRAQLWRGGQLHTGEFTYALPALAAIRADAREVWTVPRGSGNTVAFQAEGWQWHPRKADRILLQDAIEWADVYGAIGIDVPGEHAFRGPQFRAMVPTIPPALRPPHALRGYTILWEAEWTQGSMIAPGDPALLRHIGGDLYALLAVWDLSPLERAVLNGARS